MKTIKNALLFVFAIGALMWLLFCLFVLGKKSKHYPKEDGT